ncbi:MAG: ankyrin repeat domain-containing protein [Verrucomicrobiota bacterium]|nr:ankyrin repeat domain-containing protein [Verrucomicrobiota bacterium]
MNPAGFLFRTLLLALFTLSLLAGAIITDFYLRHEVAGKASRYLISRGVEVSTGGAIEAAEDGETGILRNLERAGIDLGDSDASGFTPLLAAVRSGNESTIEFLMERNEVVENINAFTALEKETPLSAALRERDFELASMLIGAGAEVDVDIKRGRPFVIDAIEKQDAEMIDFLFSHGADVEYRGAFPISAFAVAASLDNFELMQRCLKEGAAVDTRGESGNPLLIEAVMEENPKKTRLLLENGADVNILCVENKRMELTALSHAFDQGSSIVENHLFEHGANANVNGVSGEPLIVQSIAENDLVAAQRFLEEGANPNVMNKDGCTPLAIAVAEEELNAVELLIEAGADPSLSGAGMESPLLLAIENGNIAIAHMLIVSGAKFDKQRMLARAYSERNTPLMSLLLNAGADPESTLWKTDERVFDIAVRDGSTGAVRTLLDSGASIGDNLWAAILSEQDELIRLILEAGADPRQVGPGGEDPLDFCLRRGRYKAAGILLAGGANPNAQYDHSESWLSKAVREGDEKIALTLIKAGAEVIGIRSRDGHTLLGWSIAHQMTNVVEALIDAGVDVDADERSPARSEFRDMFGSRTFKYHLQTDRRIRPVMMAAALYNEEIAQMLMDAGANGQAYTRKYLTAAIIGSWHKDTDLQQIVLLGEVPNPQPRKVVVDLSSQRVTLYENGVATYSTRCSTGKSGHRTPVGEYVISDRHRHHTSSIYGTSMPYFQRFSFSAFGLHQGYVPNYPASAGCIRLPHQSARHLWDKLNVGDYCVIQQ